jgi:hypothetical protein
MQHQCNFCGKVVRVSGKMDTMVNTTCYNCLTEDDEQPKKFRLSAWLNKVTGIRFKGMR